MSSEHVIGCVGMRSRAFDVAAEKKTRFTSAILPKWARRSKSLDAPLPVLCLRGLSMVDFQEALAAPLGADAPNNRGKPAGRICRLV
jgi:hypothetical protein